MQPMGIQGTVIGDCPYNCIVGYNWLAAGDANSIKLLPWLESNRCKPRTKANQSLDCPFTFERMNNEVC